MIAEIETPIKAVLDEYPARARVAVEENFELCILDQVEDRYESIHNMLVVRGFRGNLAGTRAVIKMTYFALETMIRKNVEVNPFNLNDLYEMVSRHFGAVLNLISYTNDDAPAWANRISSEMEDHAFRVAITYAVVTELKTR